MQYNTQETQTEPLWQPRGVGQGGREARERGDMCIPMTAMLMYGRNQHRIVIVLQLKIRKKFSGKEKMQYTI